RRADARRRIRLQSLEARRGQGLILGREPKLARGRSNRRGATSSTFPLVRPKPLPMRILLAGFGTRGDVQPFVALGVALRGDGHQVTLGAAEGFEAWVRGHGLEFRTIGIDLQPFLEGEGRLLVRNPFPVMRRSLERMR